VTQRPTRSRQRVAGFLATLVVLLGLASRIGVGGLLLDPGGSSTVPLGRFAIFHVAAEAGTRQTNGPAHRQACLDCP
jgi:hypothetical protein